jgi:hypothetical protein
MHFNISDLDCQMFGELEGVFLLRIIQHFNLSAVWEVCGAWVMSHAAMFYINGLAC